MKHSILALYISAALLPASARTYTFDASLIGDSKKNVDISLFNEGLQLPGRLADNVSGSGFVCGTAGETVYLGVGYRALKAGSYKATAYFYTVAP